jgi:poly-gamma-glutamate synthesis protein (capsule biosynthesis protein)
MAIARAKRIRADVAAAVASGDADVVVVMVHAGYEYAPSPNAEQRRYARAALDAGATLVLGHHPHVLQGWTRKGSRLIHWSLGNFVFDRMGGASDTEILALDLSKDGVSDVRTIPVTMVDGLPVLD